MGCRGLVSNKILSKIKLGKKLKYRVI